MLQGKWQQIRSDVAYEVEFLDSTFSLYGGYFPEKDTVISIDEPFFEPYQLRNDSIFIQKDELKEWKYFWKIKRLSPDSLTLWQPDLQKEYKYGKQKHNPSVVKYDTIVFAGEGCFGSCPQFELILNKQGNMMYHGNRHAPFHGFYKGNLSPELTSSVFNQFAKARIQNIKDNYPKDGGDNITHSVACIKNGQVVKSLYYYGFPESRALERAFYFITNSCKKARLDTLPSNLPFYHPPIYYIEDKETRLILHKAEAFYLWTVLSKTQPLEKKFTAKYEASYPGQGYDVDKHLALRIKTIQTNGRFFEYLFSNGNKAAYDLGYDFFERNFDANRWESLKSK